LYSETLSSEAADAVSFLRGGRIKEHIDLFRKRNQ